MEKLTVGRPDVCRLLEDISRMEGTPAYRSIRGRSLASYMETGIMFPRGPNGVDTLIVGSEPAVYFWLERHVPYRPNASEPPQWGEREIIAVSTVERLTCGRRLLDVRNQQELREAEEEAKAALLAEGAGEDGYRIWERMLQGKDTITLTKSGCPLTAQGSTPVLSVKRPVTGEMLCYEITLEGPVCAEVI